MIASLLLGNASWSLLKRRAWLRHATVRSTTHRRGSTTKPRCVSDRRTTSRVRRACRHAQSTRCPRYAPSTHIRRTVFHALRRRASTSRAPSRSCTAAAVTTTTNNSPNVSTSTCRLRPAHCLPASKPRGPGRAARLTVWLSKHPAVVCLWRPARRRTCARKVSWMRCHVPSSRHLAKY